MLIVVESLGKQKTLQKILNKEATIICAGPRKRESGDFITSGDDETGFNCPKEFNKLTPQDTVYLATDPNPLGDKRAVTAKEKIPRDVPCKRLPLTRFTPHAIKSALKNAAALNGKTAAAQNLRERLTRLFDSTFRFVLDVPPLKHILTLESLLVLDFLTQAESTARLSSPEICWTIDVELKSRNKSFHVPLTKLKNQDAVFSDPNHAKACIADLKTQDFKVASATKKSKTIQPQSPYITVTLLRDAARELGFTPNQTISVARALYEGIDIGLKTPIGLITFPFTTEPNYNHKCVQAVREFVLNNYGMDYVSQKPKYKSDVDVPVAITPVDVKRTPKKVRKYLTDPQYKLYDLVWTKTVASQMKNAMIEQTITECAAGPDDRYQFYLKAEKIDFRGFLQVDSYNISLTSIQTENLSKNQSIECVDINLNKIETARAESFTVAKVFDMLYHTGLGQPENYTEILAVLADCLFIDIKDGHVHVTNTGESACHNMHKSLPNIFSTEFAKNIEKQIDLVSRARKKSGDVFRQYSTIIDAAIQKIAVQKQVCPLCGGRVVESDSAIPRRVCEFYPKKCDYVESISGENSTQICEKCGAELVQRTGRYGRFWACSRYPDCHFTKPFTISVKCPSGGCDGDVIERYSASGYLFYGCSKYPACKFASWLKPVNIACPYCGNNYMVEKPQESEDALYCPCCKHSMKETE